MYQITRKNRIKEELQLCHENGDVALTVLVDINVDQIIGRFNKAYEKVGIASAEAEKDPTNPESLEKYGEAIFAFFSIIFGEDQTKQIIEFYENSYTEMLVDLFPFLSEEIIPKINAASSARKNQMLKLAGKKRGR